MTVGELKEFISNLPDEMNIIAWLPWLENWNDEEPTPGAHRVLTIDRDYVSPESFTLIVGDDHA